MKIARFKTFINIQGKPGQLDTLMRFLWRCGSLKLDSRMVYVGLEERSLFEELAQTFPPDLAEKLEKKRQAHSVMTMREEYAKRAEEQLSEEGKKRKLWRSKNNAGKKKRRGRPIS